MKTQAEGVNRLQAFLTLICLYPLANDQSGKPIQCEVKCTDRLFIVRQCLTTWNVQQDTTLVDALTKELVAFYFVVFIFNFCYL